MPIYAFPVLRDQYQLPSQMSVCCQWVPEDQATEHRHITVDHLPEPWTWLRRTVRSSRVRTLEPHKYICGFFKCSIPYQFTLWNPSRRPTCCPPLPWYLQFDDSFSTNLFAFIHWNPKLTGVLWQDVVGVGIVSDIVACNKLAIHGEPLSYSTVNGNICPSQESLAHLSTTPVFMVRTVTVIRIQ